MSIRQTRATSIRQPRETVTVDYADVLRQAIDNERWRVLREVRRGVEAVKGKKSTNAYPYEADRPGEDVKRDILAVLDHIERGGVQ